MSKANQDLCVAVIRTFLEAAPHSIPTKDVAFGRKPKSPRPPEYVLIRKRPSPRTSLVSGAKTREYDFEVQWFTRAGDIQEGTTGKNASDDNQELLIDAFDAKTEADYPTIVGLKVIEAVQITTDEQEDTNISDEEIMTRTAIRFPIWETL